MQRGGARFGYGHRPRDIKGGEGQSQRIRTNSGSGQTSVMRRISVNTSSSVEIPRSGGRAGPPLRRRQKIDSLIPRPVGPTDMVGINSADNL